MDAQRIHAVLCRADRRCMGNPVRSCGDRGPPVPAPWVARISFLEVREHRVPRIPLKNPRFRGILENGDDGGGEKKSHAHAQYDVSTSGGGPRPNVSHGLNCGYDVTSSDEKLNLTVSIHPGMARDPSLPLNRRLEIPVYRRNPPRRRKKSDQSRGD